MKGGKNQQPSNSENGEKEKLAKRENVSVFQLLRYGDGFDKCLVFLGTVGSIGEGMMTPLTMVVLSGLMNTFGGESFVSYTVVDEYTFKLLCIALGVGIAAFMEGFCWTRTAERQVSRMRCKYLKSVLRQDIGFFDTLATNSSNSTTYEMVSAISTDTLTIQDVMSEKIPNFIMNISTFFSSLIVSFYMSWRLALFGVPLSLSFIIPGLIYGKRLMEVVMKMKEAYGVAGGIAEQALSSIRTVFSYVGERRTMESFCSTLDQSLKLGIKQGFMKGLVIGSIGMIYAVWAFQAWYGSVLVTEMGATGGNVSIAAICTIMGGLGIMGALPNLKHFSEATVAATKIFEMIDRLPIINSDDGRGVKLKKTKGKIQFKDVDFAYPSRSETPILQSFNLTVIPGQTVGLVGGSGSGKSTVISLLQRFYDPLGGDILLDGKSISRLNLRWLRSQMGLVSQEPVLFATSIKENILFGNETASMELVVSAAKAANAHNFINQLPNGYDTQVGEFGVQMSGGQKQRIAIARALIRDPKILLLDEATSALDAQSERIVQDALDQAVVGRTTIIIAHRLSTLDKADLIGVLQSGKLVEFGSHDELMQIDNGNGPYSTMMQLQQAAVRSEPLAPPSSLTFFLGTNYSSNMMNSIPSTAKSSKNSTPARSFTQEEHSIKPNAENKQYPRYPSPSQWRLLQMNSPEWKNAMIGCFGAVTLGAAQPFHSYNLGSVISVFFLKDNDLIKSKIKLYCFIFVSIAVITITTNLLQHYNFAIMGERLTKRVRENMLEKILTFEIGWFDEDENSTGAICARLAAEANVVRSLVGDRLSLLVQVFTTATVAFALGTALSWRLGIVMIAMQPLIIGSIYSRKVLMQSMSVKSRKAQNEGSKLASESIVNHRTITAFCSQKRVLGLFEAAQKDPHNENIKQSWCAGLGLFTSQFLTTASIALSFWYGGRLLIQGLLSPKQMFQTFFVLITTGKIIADAGSMTSDLAKGADAVKSVFAILDRESKIKPDEPNGIKRNGKIKGQVELKRVYFAYPSRPDQMIFRGLSYKIEAGSTVALVGHSGSGKSTVIGLIERFYDPLGGSVEIDGVDIRRYNLRSLRSHIALVIQEPTLFAGTIGENIAYGKNIATSTEIIEAATLANAHEFICGMKDGYGTYCGERGVQLSGGQKQRIALARAMLMNPAILLLDEATSALDSISESLVQQALDNMMIGRTCIVVAHRLATIQKSDCIAVIENGRVVEQGSHFNLLAKGAGGSYFTLVNQQFYKSS